jgi:YfiH family protein
MEFKKIDNKKFFNGLETGTIIDSTFFEEVKVEDKNVGIIRFKPFKDLDFIECGFSTRLGGVSTGVSESMNFCLDRADIRENVLENFRIFSTAINTDVKRLVISKQTHTTNVLYVHESNAGMGLVRQRNYDNIDGLITDKKGLCLVTASADCVPVIFIDKKRHVIGSAHSGWRGTVGNITKNVIEQMGQKFGTKAEDLVTFIGPSICMDCYEISEDVADEFKKAYSSKE